MRNVLYYALLTVFLLPALIGCSKIGGEKPDSPVIASVDKDSITENDFLREVGKIPEWARVQFKGDEGKNKFLDELIKRELIYQHAKKMRLDNNEEYLAKIKEFEKMTLVSLVLKKEIEEKAFVDDKEAQEFFDQNADKFTIGTQLKASHILVETEEEAIGVQERINNGESFPELAKELSKDKGSALKGGDLGYFGRGKMVPEFERAASSLKPGEVSDPVKTRFGYHIIKLVDIKKGDPASFEQSKESIKKQLLAEKRKKLFDSYVEKLKLDSKITKDETVLSSLTLPWEQAEEQPAPQTQETEKQTE
jgi:peptidyl-prolyl cis-trans isomerase C